MLGSYSLGALNFVKSYCKHFCLKWLCLNGKNSFLTYTSPCLPLPPPPTPHQLFFKIVLLLFFSLKHKNIFVFKADTRVSEVSVFPELCSVLILMDSWRFYHLKKILKTLMQLYRTWVGKLIAISESVPPYSFFLMPFSKDAQTVSVQINLIMFCATRQNYLFICCSLSV